MAKVVKASFSSVLSGSRFKEKIMSKTAETLSSNERFIIDETALYVYQCRFGENFRAIFAEDMKENPDKEVIERLLKKKKEIAIEERKIKFSDDMQYKIDYIKKHGKNARK